MKHFIAQLTLSSLVQSVTRPADWQDWMIIVCLLQTVGAVVGIVHVLS